MSLVGLLFAFPAFSPLRAVRPGLTALNARHGVSRTPPAPSMQMQAPVPLTGQTLQASLKLRCDTTGAQYAIYWSEQSGVLKEIGYYAATPTANSYAEGSKAYTIAADGDGPIAEVQRSGNSLFISNVMVSHLKRKELAFKNGVSQIVMEPFEAGVIEYGNTRSREQWASIPAAPVMPKAQLRKAFEDLGALYAIYWKADRATGKLRVIADYENPRETALRKALRSDGESFVKISRELELEIDAEGPVQAALKTGQEQVVSFSDEESFSRCTSMKRAAFAKEFNLCAVTMVPVIDEARGEYGVLEYGVSTTAEFNPETIDATLKMQVESANALYGIYWKQDGKVARAAKTFKSPKYNAYLQAAQKQFSFVDVSEQTTVDVEGASPVAQAIRTRSKLFVSDVSQMPDERAAVASEYFIGSIAYVPVVGGVIEYGVPGASAGGTWWSGEDEALAQTIPNEEIDAALASGATYIIFWKRDEQGGVFRVAAEYERASNALNADAKDADSYVKVNARNPIPLVSAKSGPIATAFRSAAKLAVDDVATYGGVSENRKATALEFGVGKFTCIPLETGVLEFGRVTKDKRETTKGSEYKESSRQYRRTVFMHGEWEDHRSTERYFKNIMAITESGVLRGRQDEVSIVTAFASFIVFYNAIAGGLTDFDLVKHAALIPHLPVLGLPLSFFTLSGSSLGLLLVFRTNAAYARWDDARKQWGSIINNCRSLVRQANTFFNEDRYPGFGNFRDYRRRVAAETSAFTRCLRCFLRGKSDDPNLQVELKRLGFGPDEVNGYMSSANRQCYALQKLGETARLYGMVDQDRSRFDQTLSVLCDNVGACERIFKSPIPLVYTRHTSRYVGLWLGLLPLAIYGADSSWNHLATIPACGLITFLLLGIEELGLQIEEPFGILPMEAFCDGAIYAALNEAVISEDKKRSMESKLDGALPLTMPSAPAVAPPTVDAGAIADAEAQVQTLAAKQAAAAAAADKAAERARRDAEAASAVERARAMMG